MTVPGNEADDALADQLQRDFVDTILPLVGRDAEEKTRAAIERYLADFSAVRERLETVANANTDQLIAFRNDLAERLGGLNQRAAAIGEGTSTLVERSNQLARLWVTVADSAKQKERIVDNKREAFRHDSAALVDRLTADLAAVEALRSTIAR